MDINSNKTIDNCKHEGCVVWWRPIHLHTIKKPVLVCRLCGKWLEVKFKEVDIREIKHYNKVK